MRIFLASFLLVAILSAGCAHYQLGNASRNLPFQTLYVKPVINRSFAPQAQALLSDQLRRALQQEGNITIVSDEASADATLEVVLTDYSRTILSTSDQDTYLANSYLLELTAQCTLAHNLLTVIYFYEKPVTATVQVQVGDSLVSSEYQNMPVLTRQLATRINNLVISSW